MVNLSDVPSRLIIAPYYKNPTLSEQQSQVLETHAAAAYDAAKRGDVEEASRIILRWSLHCGEVVQSFNSEAYMPMMTWGSLFLEASLLLDPIEWNSGVFLPWVQTIYRPCAEFYYKNQTNQGSWGILGCILSDRILGLNPSSHRERLANHIKQSFNDAGVMVHEIKRTNSGMWYSYYSLAPLLRACQLLDVEEVSLLEKPLDWLFQYCLNPDIWPYKLPPGLRGWIWKLIYPCSSKVEIPMYNSWPANLYAEAGKMFDRQEWISWTRPPFGGVSIFRS